MLNQVDKYTLEIIIEYAISNLHSILLTCKLLCKYTPTKEQLLNMLHENKYIHITRLLELSPLFKDANIRELYKIYTNILLGRHKRPFAYTHVVYTNKNINYGLKRSHILAHKIQKYLVKVYGKNYAFSIIHGDLIEVINITQNSYITFIYDAEKDELISNILSEKYISFMTNVIKYIPVFYFSLHVQVSYSSLIKHHEARYINNLYAGLGPDIVLNLTPYKNEIITNMNSCISKRAPLKEIQNHFKDINPLLYISHINTLQLTLVFDLSFYFNEIPIEKIINKYVHASTSYGFIVTDAKQGGCLLFTQEMQYQE